jgi:ABC-type multidrug transport system fused ATPase/permease subunit
MRAMNADNLDVANLFAVLTAFTVYVTRFFDPIRDLVMQYTMFQRAMAGGERIFQVLTRPLASRTSPMRSSSRLWKAGLTSTTSISITSKAYRSRRHRPARGSR